MLLQGQIPCGNFLMELFEENLVGFLHILDSPRIFTFLMEPDVIKDIEPRGQTFLCLGPLHQLKEVSLSPVLVLFTQGIVTPLMVKHPLSNLPVSSLKVINVGREINGFPVCSTTIPLDHNLDVLS